VSFETVSLVFTDLVGSTELAARMGPVLAEELRKEHFALLRGCCEEAGGREVKSLGDGLMLAFGSVNRALDAAAAVQRAVDDRNRTARHRFEIRIGVAVGEVAAEEGDYFGEAVVQASRLTDLAQGGQVLVTDLVRTLAAPSSTRTFTDLGPVALKGLADPVAVCELAWTAGDSGRPPLPTRLRGAPEAAYVGRAAEVEALDRAWTAATAGRGGLVLLAGEPGIGKTRLASRQAFAAHAAGGTVLYGAVDEGLGIPYQPWVEALAHYVEHAPDALLERYVADAGADLCRLVPDLARRVPDLPPLVASDGETERYLLLQAITRFLRAASEHNPVLLVLDDLHWADKQTLLLLLHLHRTLVDTPVLVVGTYRDSELHDAHPLADVLATLRREERVERLELQGLEAEDIVDLLEAISRQESTPASVELARVLERHTSGNPLFLAEVLRDLLERGHLAQDDQGVWALTTPIDQLPTPASVRDVVTQRVHRLGAEPQRILTTAAVIGRDFELDLLAAVLEEDPVELLGAMEEAMAASLLTETGSRAGAFRFVHAVIAQALAENLSTARRVQLHQRIASTIEGLHGPDLGDRVAAVAGHLLAAGDDPGKTIDYVRRAGTRALAALAPDEALRWFQTALDLYDRSALSDPELRCDIVTDLGEAMRDAGHPDARDHLMSAAGLARVLDDGDRLARALLAMNRSIATSVGAADEELIAAMEAALARSDRPDATRARLLAQLASELSIIGTLERRLALVEEALAIARSLDDETLARVITSSLGAYFTTAAHAERVALLAELEALLPSVADPQLAGYAAVYGVWIGLEAADRLAVARSLDAARRECARATQPALAWLLAQLEAIVARCDGDLDAAEAFAADALEQANAAGLRDGFIYYATQTVGTRIAAGRLGELVELIRDSFEANPSIDGTLRVILALALVERGDLEEASAMLGDALADDFGIVPNSHSWGMVLDMAALAANRIGRTDVAARIEELFAPLPEVMLVTGPQCSVHTLTTRGVLAATLGRHDDADEHFSRAAEILEAFAPIPYGRNLYEHGRALLELGDPADEERARRLLTRAATTFERFDLGVRVAQCEELLARLP
jgi:class 3 adenylate cyclase/tetratricopeptide (TPR) repeat protein